MDPAIALVPTADDPSTYAVAIEANVGGRTVQWPVGVVVEAVKLDASGLPSFTPQPLIPNVSKVDGAAFRAALAQIGLPKIVSLGELGTANVTRNFDHIEAIVPIAIGSFYQGNLDVVLVDNGKSYVLASLNKELGKIVAGISAQLKASPPSLRFAGNAVGIEDVQVAVGPSLTEATIDGKLRLRLGTGGATIFGDDVSVPVKLAVPFDGKAVRLVEARWPDGLKEKLYGALKQRLPQVKIDLGQCIGVSGFALTLNDKGDLGLAATLIADGKPKEPISVDPSSPFQDIAKHFVALAEDPTVEQCVARQILRLANADAIKALDDLKTRRVSIAGIDFAIENTQILQPDGKVRFKADLVAADDPNLAIRNIIVDFH
jgi:hypothetical protein